MPEKIKTNNSINSNIDSNVPKSNVNVSPINNNSSSNSNLKGIAPTGKVETEELDLSRISTSASGALNENFVSVNEDYFKNNNLSYQVRDDDSVQIKADGETLGFTDTSGISKIISDVDIPTGINTSKGNYTSYNSQKQTVDNKSTYQRKPNDKMVQVALSQVGNVGGEPYWRWFGNTERFEWCAAFVSWVSNQLGYIDAGIVPKFDSCTTGMNWFKEKNEWQEPGYIPSPGDIIFFDWKKPTDEIPPDHVGIVEKVEDGKIYTIEGNSDDACRQKVYPINSDEIFGFATPDYQNKS